MDIKKELSDSLKDAMRSGDEVRRGTIRMVLAAIKQAEVDRRVVLDDAALLAILQKEIKTRRESLEEAERAGRDDLASAARAEIDVISAFLPKGLEPEDLNALVKEAIAEAGATSVKDMGKVMKILMPKVAGRAPGDQVSAAVREQLPG